MIKRFFMLLLLEIIFITVSHQQCVDEKNFCKKCNPLNGLCLICQNEVLIPDDNGACIGSNVCSIGKNYCEECDSTGNKCKECSEGFYPDQNGGCSYTDHCIISSHGKCLLCESKYILIGEENGLRICRALNSEDFLNCQKIDYIKGQCEACEEGYFLNEGDKRCTLTENCYESIYGKCTSCIENFYFNQKDCLNNTENKEFLHCKETEDEKTCSKCEVGYYLDEENKCVNTNFCSESVDFYCQKCISGYYLSKDTKSCTTEENCYTGDLDSGACNFCISGYYIDMNDRKCKSNQEDNDDLKNCKIFSDKCTACESGYELGEDNKCTKMKNCEKSENGICLKCSEGYYLTKENICTNIEHCISTSDYNYCYECEEKYYYNAYKSECQLEEGYFMNCRITNWHGDYCSECKEDYYLYPFNHTCHSNKEKGKFYKCAEIDMYENECIRCIFDYHLSSKDKVCTPLDGCAHSEENKCLECEELFCLNIAKGICEDNIFIDEEEKKFYFHCKMTNEEGTSCEICDDDYKLGNNGYCMDTLNCEEEKDGTCIKCKEGNCLNPNFGCVRTYFNDNCLKCDEDLNSEQCTECLEGYELDEDGSCIGTK